MNFRIRQLEYFLVLAEKLNFGKSAEALGIAQPTLSFQIKSLEKSLGVMLFHRTQRRVSLTPVGARLRDHATIVLENIQQVMDAVDGRRSDRLTISCGPVGQFTVLPDVLRKLRTRHPELQLTMLTLTPEQMKQAACDGTVDVLLMTPDWQLPGMEFEMLRAEKLTAVLPEDHPAVNRGWISLEEFSQRPVMVVAEKDCHKHRHFITDLLERHHLTAELVEFPSGGSLQFAMVAAGRGVAMAAGSMAQVHFPGVRLVPFDRPVHNMGLGIMWQSRTNSRAVGIFCDVVREVLSHQNEAIVPYAHALAGGQGLTSSVSVS